MLNIAWGLGIQQMYQARNIPPSFHAYFFPTHNTQCIHVLNERDDFDVAIELSFGVDCVLNFIKKHCWVRIRRTSNSCL